MMIFLKPFVMRGVGGHVYVDYFIDEAQALAMTKELGWEILGEATWHPETGQYSFEDK